MANYVKMKKPSYDCRPEVRWWLAEGFHTDQTLKNDIRMIDEAGFGAVEFLAMEELGADSRLYGWGSEEWVHDSHVIFEEAVKRGMGISVTSGTNWANANLTTIYPDHKAAAKELDCVVEPLEGGRRRYGKIPRCVITTENVQEQLLVAAVAARVVGEKDGAVCLDKESLLVLNDYIKEETLDWTAPEDGSYLVFYCWMHGTGQTAGPSAEISYTINYLDRYGVEAFIEYWDNVVWTAKLRENIRKSGRCMMYMDSLELSTFGHGGQLWGYHFVEEFQKRRGYNVLPYLPFLLKENGQGLFTYFYRMEDEIFERKLHNDLYQTMTELYMDNMLKPMQEWLHGMGMQLRAEISYGLPFDISQPGKYVDGIETESLEFACQIDGFRNMSGAAHIYDRLYSSETGAIRLNYMMGLEFYTQIIYTQFAAGVAKTVLHGYASIAGAEESTYWPGHEGMWPNYSDRFGCRQPAYQHYQDWTAMLSRYHMLLREGKPRMDLGILRLDYNFNNLYWQVEDEKGMYEKEMMRAGKANYWQDMGLQHAGYTWDYFAPQLLEEEFVTTDGQVLLPQGPEYQALIVYQDMMPRSSAEKLYQLARAGLKIVFVNNVTEHVHMNTERTNGKAASMTPYNDGEDEALCEVIAKIKALPNVRETDEQAHTIDCLWELGVFPRVSFTKPSRNILTFVRETETTIYLFAYNMMYQETTAHTFEVEVKRGGKPYLADCWNGEIREIGCYRKRGESTLVERTLQPGEACMLLFEKKKKDEVYPEAVTKEGKKASKDCELMGENGTWYGKVFCNGSYEVYMSDGSRKVLEAQSPEDVELSEWELTVEDWNEGEKKIILEDRGLGIVTREVYYETSKKCICAGKTDLRPWKNIACIGPEVSGVGYYRTSFSLSEAWNDAMGAVLELGTTNGNSAAVYVNGKKARAVDFDTCVVDVSELLVPGVNELLVEVSSTLNNRLSARGYYEDTTEISLAVSSAAGNQFDTVDSPETEATRSLLYVSSRVQDYGMTGRARLRTYRKIQIL